MGEHKENEHEPGEYERRQRDGHSRPCGVERVDLGQEGLEQMRSVR